MNTIAEKNLFLQKIECGLKKIVVCIESLKQKNYQTKTEFMEELSEFEFKLNEIKDVLIKLHKMTDNIKPTFSSAIRKFLGHKRVTEKEYYLLCAEKILEFKGFDGLNEAQRFDMHCYETDEIYSHIMPCKTPGSGGWGIEPEEVEVKYLRPEQKEYFYKYDPVTYNRFKK